MRRLSAEYTRGPVATAVGLLTFLVLGLAGSWMYFSALGLGCDSEEQSVYGEFPQFGDRRIEPRSNLEAGNCSARYETRKDRREIQDYYVRQLVANGWKVTLKPSQEKLAPPEKTVMQEPVPGEPGKTREVMVGDEGSLVAAERDGYYYEVDYFSLQDYIEPRPGLEISVRVGKY